MSESGMSGITFSNFIGGFTAAGIAALQDLDQAVSGEQDESAGSTEATGNDDREQRIRNGLATLQHLIDTLTMLEQKTEGNLSDDERQVLQATLTELRFGYVRVRDRSQTSRRSH